MNETWFEALRHRLRSTWDVFMGRAYAGYSVPDVMDEVRLRIALLPFAKALERCPEWYDADQRLAACINGVHLGDFEGAALALEQQLQLDGEKE
jgi:hypothetical protein